MRLNLSRFLVGACLAAFVTCNTMSQEPKAKGGQQTKKFSGRSSGKLSAEYLLFLPEDSGAKKTKKWPLILFLHGAGERGTNLWLVAKHGPPKIVQNKPGFPFIVVSPQCPEGLTWSDDLLLALLADLEAHYAVDSSRLYLTGLSMGGYGTWSLGLSHPDRFAAIAPICGGGDTLKVLLPEPSQAAALKTLPVWAFHGARDDVVKPEESERMVQALKQAGCVEVKHTVYPEANHDSWTETYNNPALYDWFLAHQRKPARAK